MTRRTSTVLVAALLAVGASLSASPPAMAGSDGPCPSTTGVTVVVDFQALGGGVSVRCAPGSPDSGFEALQSAGFDIVQVTNMPGFLCRIDGRPGPQQEDCLNTPPGSAYWSYWTASRGGTWKVSPEGAGTRTPPVGSVEGWSFSDDGSPGAAPPPGIDPPDTPATPKPATPKPATPKPTATPMPATPKPTTPKPATPTPQPATTPSTSSAAAATTQPLSASASPPTSPTPAASSSATAASAVPSTSPVVVAVAGAATDGGNGPGEIAQVTGEAPPIGTVIGVVLVLLVAGGTLVARSRRSSGRTP